MKARQSPTASCFGLLTSLTLSFMSRSIQGKLSALLAYMRRPIMAKSVSSIRPPALPVFKTCIWKIVDDVHIALDIYLPNNSRGEEHPILLFIHGGGWIASNKKDYSRPLFQEFLGLGFVVVSIDYRLLPETAFGGQLEDIRDIEGWLRQKLPSEVEQSTFREERTFRVSTDNIVVAGGSAGAHLALLTVRQLLFGYCSWLTSVHSQNFGQLLQ